MTAPFDFQSLAAQAHTDNPDAELFDALETYGEQERVYKRERRGEAMWRAVGAAQDAQQRIAAVRPATLDGLLVKLRHAFERGRRARPRSATFLDLQRAAALDAIAWFEGRGRAGAPASDAALFETIEADKAAYRRFGQAHAQLRRRSVDGRDGISTEPGPTWRRLATASRETHERVAATRPATLEGLAAKLRYAEKRMHRCPASDLRHAALLDAMAWLRPCKPKRGQGAGRKRVGSRL